VAVLGLELGDFASGAIEVFKEEAPQLPDQIPLTLTLSQGEREQPTSLREISSSRCFVNRLSLIFPLPSGEGWGEGTSVGRSTELSDVQVSHVERIIFDELTAGFHFLSH